MRQKYRGEAASRGNTLVSNVEGTSINEKKLVWVFKKQMYQINKREEDE
jgi:hypothetical protein